MRKLLMLFGALATLAAAAWLASPYVAVWRLSQAVKAGDAQAVARVVDFPAVRENLKPQLAAYLDAESKRGKPRSLLDQLGLALAPYLLGSAVDLVVTPETLTAMLRTARPPKVGGPAGPPPPEEAQGPRAPTDTRAVRMSYAGADLDLFRAEIASRARPERRVVVRLVRRGVFAWKVVSVELPPAAFLR